MTSIRLASFALLAASVFPLAVGCSASATDPEEDVGESTSALNKAVNKGGIDNDPIFKAPIDKAPVVSAEPSGAVKTSPTPVTHQGILNRLMVGRSESGAAPGYRWFVRTTDANKKSALQEVALSAALLAKAGGPGKVIGSKVTVTGKSWAINDALIADLLVLADSGPPPFTPPPVVGARKWLTIPCRFSDVPNADPHDPTYFQGIMGSAAPGAGHFFSKASNGRLSVDGSAVLNWQDLPLPASHYNSFNANSRLGMLINDCVQTADPLVDYTQFDGIQLAFSHNLETQLVGGPFSLDLDGALKTYAFGVLSPAEFVNQSSVVRTMGMGLDMTFSGSGALRFDSPWDFMSQGYGTTNGITCRSLTSSFGCGAVLPAGEQAVRSGWVDAGQVAYVGAGSAGTFEVDFRGRVPQPGHHALIRTEIDSQRWFTIEAREQAPDSYDIGVPQTDVVIHRMDAVPLPDSPTDPQLNDAATRLRLVAALNGQSTFVDNALRLKLEVVKRTYGYTVKVTRGTTLRVIKSPDVRVTGAGIDCGTPGHVTCAVSTNFDESLTLTAHPVSGRRVADIAGCTSRSGNTCVVEMTASRTVSVTTQSSGGPGGDDGPVCKCPPTMPAYKCQLLCLDP